MGNSAVAGIFSGDSDTFGITGETVAVSFPIGRPTNTNIKTTNGGITFQFPTLSNESIRFIVTIPIIVTDSGAPGILTVYINDIVTFTQEVNCGSDNTLTVDKIFRETSFLENSISVTIQVSGSSNIRLGGSRSISLIQ